MHALFVVWEMVTGLSPVYHVTMRLQWYFLCHLYIALIYVFTYNTNPHPFNFNLFFLLFVSGWTKGSLSLDASVEHDGYFSAEEQVTSDPEEEKEDKLVQGHVCFLLLDLKAKGCHV